MIGEKGCQICPSGGDFAHFYRFLSDLFPKMLFHSKKSGFFTMKQLKMKQIT